MSDAERDALQAAITFWEAFDLDGRRQKMDMTCLELKEGKEAAQKSRKMLAESTKEFRKMTDAEKVVTVKDLIRGYQEEVDSLTKRARSSDGAFFSLYKDLYEAPDPAGALKLAAAARPRAAASSLELEKLKAEVAAYEAEFKELKNQDITIRTLEEKLEDLEEAMDKQVAEQVEVVKAEIETDANRRVDEVLEREAALERRVAAGVAQLADAHAVADGLQTKLFESSRVYDERLAAQQAEGSIWAEQSEKHGAAVLRLERENDLLRQRLDAFATTPSHASPSSSSSSRDGSSCSPSSSSSEWVLDPGAAAARLQQAESEVGELRREVAQLRQDALNQSRAWEAQLRTATAQAAAAEAEATSAQDKVKHLTSELAAATPPQEVEGLRRQLRALQKAEFHAEDDSEDEGNAFNHDSSGTAWRNTKERTSINGSNSSDRESQKRADAALSAVMTSSELEDDASPETTSTVEKLLMVRLRRAENLQVATRRAADESEQRAVVLANQLAEAQKQAKERDELVRRLEDHLATGQQHQTGPSGGGSNGTNSIAAPVEGEGAGLAALLESTGDEINGSKNSNSSSNSAIGAGKVGGSSSTSGAQSSSANDGSDMLSIVVAQRDRFMGRIHDLERERAINARQLSAAKATSQQLQRDNLQLYEKIRYLQSYASGGGSGNSGGGHGIGLSARHLEDGLGDMEGRYKSLYEQQTNPFTQFSQAERARKYNELTTAEKITLNTTRALLSSKPGRTFAFFYVLGLHLLVFSTVLHWSHSEACTNSAPPRTNHHAPPAAHMHGFVAPSSLASSAASDMAAEVIAAAAEVT